MAIGRLPRLSARSVDLGELLDAFLVCAVGTVLGYRLFLHLSGYPQLGGGQFHIAHVLLGGLLMMIAIVVAVALITRGARLLAAVVGGIGFGFFIDELGKFITKDTNYFYKPTAALIYVVFIVMVLAFRALQRQRGFSQREYLVNAIELLKEAAVHDLDEVERRRAISLLGRADQDDPLVEPLRELLEHVNALPTSAPGPATRTARRLRRLYVRVVQRPLFDRAMTAVFLVLALGSPIQVLTLVDLGDLSFVSKATIISALASVGLVLAGVFRLRNADLAGAYRMFDRSLLVTIFITEVFAFARSEFTAVFGLAVYLLAWVVLRSMMAAERRSPARPVAG